jgi:predicted flavoprotein YhiN
VRDHLIRLLVATPLTIVGLDGFDKAMITRGGIRLKEVNPRTLESKVIDGLYFAGEILDLDGPCGGYNLQWAFASGVLAGEIG